MRRTNATSPKPVGNWRRLVFDQDAKEDIAIVCQAGFVVSLALASGCERRIGKSGDFVFTPAGPWIEIDYSLEGAARPSVSDVVLVRAEGEILARLQEAADAIHRTNDKSALGDVVQDLSELQKQWATRLGLFSDRRTLSSNLALHPSGLESTAFDREHDEYRGLHIDDHQKLTFDRRSEGFVLFNINLGRTIRHLRFVAKTVGVLISGCGRVPVGRIADVKNRCLASASRPRIYSVALPPFSAYFLQTQNVIHDGATNKTGHPDVSLLTALMPL